MKSSQIHVVFDVSNSGSIKNAERIRKSCGQALFLTIDASKKIKQWNLFPSLGENKTQLLNFIVNQWNQKNPNIFYATADSKCYNI